MSTAIPTPSIEYGVLSPILIVLGIAVAGVLVEAFAPRRARYATQVTLGVSGLLAAFGALAQVYRETTAGRTAAVGAVVIDRPGLFLQGAILLIGVLGVLLIGERRNGFDSGAEGLDAFTPQASASPGSLAEAVATKARNAQTEVFPLTMFAVGGMMLFPAAGDLLTMFIALEVLSLPLYLMCGLARYRRLQSQEASLKYFLLGAFSSAFFLYGMALLYGYGGTLSLTGIADALNTGGDGNSLALIGVGLVAVGRGRSSGRWGRRPFGGALVGRVSYGSAVSGRDGNGWVRFCGRRGLRDRRGWGNRGNCRRRRRGRGG